MTTEKHNTTKEGFFYSSHTKEGYELMFGHQDFEVWEEVQKIVTVHCYTTKEEDPRYEQSGYFLELEDGSFSCAVCQSEYYGNSFDEAFEFLKKEWLS